MFKEQNAIQDDRQENEIVTNPELNNEDEFIHIAYEHEQLLNSLDNLLLEAVIRREISSEHITNIKRIRLELEKSKEALIAFYDQAIPIAIESLEISQKLAQYTVLRLSSVINSPSQTHYFKKGLFREKSETKLFHFYQTTPLLREVFSLFPSNMQPVGIEINEVTHQITVVTLYFHRGGVLQKLSISMKSDDKERLEQERKDKKILIAVEGDIAGHAIRALETARGLRSIGYEPDIIGHGYYMSSFTQDGFTLLPCNDAYTNGEREKIIARARGEKGAGIFFWSFAAVRERVEHLTGILKQYVGEGVNLFISDMNPLADIAVRRLKSEKGLNFPCLTQTHDIGLSGSRILQSIKISGIPVGKILSHLESNRVARLLLSSHARERINGLIFDRVANVFMGSPLFVNEQLYFIQKRKQFRPKKTRFTDYLQGSDGTLLFTLDTTTCKTGYYPVGLQAEKSNPGSVEQKEIPIPVKLAGLKPRASHLSCV